ncbi:hypothetical protein SBV1_2490020 [Verrucomicrobia bacterium]|nr:hypothetical protein SBV1_2490020 [Verrucomicrobiota bacterium]
MVTLPPIARLPGPVAWIAAPGAGGLLALSFEVFPESLMAHLHHADWGKGTILARLAGHAAFEGVGEHLPEDK